MQDAHLNSFILKIKCISYFVCIYSKATNFIDNYDE